MDCLNGVQHEHKTLVSLFPRTHERLQIMSAELNRNNTGKVTCRFIDLEGRKHEIHALTTETYPDTPPNWCTESEDVRVREAVSEMNATPSLTPTPLLNQVQLLLTSLCGLFSIQLPSFENSRTHPAAVPASVNDNEALADESDHVDMSISSTEDEDQDSEQDAEQDKDQDNKQDEDLNDDQDEDQDDYQDDGQYEDEDEDQDIFGDIVDDEVPDNSEESDVDPEHRQVLERLKNNQVRDHGAGRVTGSTATTGRLMQELSDIYKSDSFKSGAYQVELVDDSLYKWTVKLCRLDADSPLGADLAKLQEQGGLDHILLSFVFKDNFPFDPPFVHVIRPRLDGGFVLRGGGICFELLTPQVSCH